MHGRLVEMAGKTFGRWTVIELDSIRNTNAYWKCRCECGTEKAVAAGSLKTGMSTSCGCHRAEMKTALTHGMTYSPTWHSWSKMKQRGGLNKRSKHHTILYAHVDADPRWASFEEFIKDMGERPSRKHSLDRIDNSKGYWKENCRWALPDVQFTNRRSTIVVQLHDESVCLKEACRRLGLKYFKVYHRIRRGWSIEKALASA